MFSNKSISLMVLGVIGAAMLLVFFLHMNTETVEEAVIENSSINMSDGNQSTNGLEVTENSNILPLEESASNIQVSGAENQPEAAEQSPSAAIASANNNNSRTPDTASPALSSAVSINASLAKFGTIKNLHLGFRAQGMVLTIEGDVALSAKYFILPEPDRIVIDLPGAWKNLVTPSIPSNQLLTKVRIGKQSNADRIVIDLNRKLSKHELIRINENKVEIFFE